MLSQQTQDKKMPCIKIFETLEVKDFLNRIGFPLSSVGPTEVPIAEPLEYP